MLKFKNKQGKIVGVLKDSASEPEGVMMETTNLEVFEDDEITIPEGVEPLEKLDQEGMSDDE